MIATQDLNNLGQNFMSLGPRRQIALGVVGALLMAGVGLLAYGISAAPMKMLYTGLLKTEVSSIAGVLSQAGIKFDKTPAIQKARNAEYRNDSDSVRVSQVLAY